MITFRKKTEESDLIPTAEKYLKSVDVQFDKIKPEQADQKSKVNSKTMVLVSFKRNNQGFYQISVMDKEHYAYTRKFLETYCDMKILEDNKTKRIFTAQTDTIGKALDVIELLGIKYNLSVVEE